jgi:hypothetical protein
MSSTTERPIAMTVSTKFSDILKLTLPANCDLFDAWYIVTAEDDLETRSLISEYHDRGVRELLWDFQGFYRDHQNLPTIPYFNKGGALALAQEKAYREYPNHWYLCMDTDIIIRSRRDIITYGLSEHAVYGAAERRDYRSWNDYCQGLCQGCRHMSHEDPTVIGFFQLYKEKKFYWNHINSFIDSEFTRLWEPNRRYLLNITVDHLGYSDETTQDTKEGRPFIGHGWNND